MLFKGRTVIAFVLLAMFMGCILTLTITDSPLQFNRVNAISDKSETATKGLNDKDIAKIKTTYDLIKNDYVADIDHDKVLSGAINGMLGSLGDPYSMYMDPAEAAMFEESVNSSFQGIGAEVALEEGRVTIMSPIKGTPAERAGLMTNDVILAVNGEKLDGLTITQAVSKIRGPKGSQAKLSILRPGSMEPVEIIVVRDEISVETVNAEMLPNQIGKIDIHQFSVETADHFRTELTKLEAAGMKGLIIDVRNDPGGILPKVVDIAQHFVPKGQPILQIENREGKREQTPSQNPNPPKKYPLVVLINNGSASASEILAGAIQQTAGGKLVGEKTYGKGTVQASYDRELGDGSYIKMTILKWLTPDGTWIDKKGIEPDVSVEQPALFRVAPFTKKNTLKLDMADEDVKTLQTMLTGIGYPTGRTDGYFNNETQQQVRWFQSKFNLPVTGEVDTAMMTALEKEVIAFIKDPKNDMQLKAAVSTIENMQLGK